MKFPRPTPRRAFTLVELLVIIAVIAILAGLLLVGIGIAQRRGREAHCTNNLKQFAIAIIAYRSEHKDTMPPWLSSLYPKYMSTGSDGSRPSIYICLDDRAIPKGAQGGKPDGVPWIGDQFSETDDIASNTHPLRNPQITLCSYLYEFSAAKCSWGWQSYLADDPTVEKLDLNKDGEVSWGEAKIWQLEHGDNTYLNNGRPYSQATFPAIRCFWHMRGSEGRQVLNLSYDGRVYKSVLKWELDAK
jgi:type II secretory pathway pseudopilin PulG